MVSGMNGAMEPDDGSMTQISIKFVTKLPPEFHVPSEPLAVPANLTRLGLSKIVNSLLGLDPARPFDFLIQGELLRISLHKHLLQRQITTEALLEVEYIPAVLPPEPKEQHSHDDWIGSIAGVANNDNNNNAVITGCYDGTVNVWEDGEKVCTFLAHTGPVKASATTSFSTANNNQVMLLTSGDDCVARAWCWDTTSSDSGLNVVPEHIAVLKGHSASIEALAIAPSGKRCATGAWDNKICLWRAGSQLVESSSNDDASTKKKKRKVGSSANTATDAVPAAPHEEMPLIDLSGHTQCVSGLAWPTENTLISCSWDHAVTVWDLEVYASNQKLTHNKAVQCIAAKDNIVAFGGAEKIVRIWDTRISGNIVSTLPTLSTHTDWVSALAWHPTSEHHVVSASYDKTAKLWDLRATMCPLYTLAEHTEKILCCAWVGESNDIVTGGADNTFRRFTVQI